GWRDASHSVPHRRGWQQSNPADLNSHLAAALLPGRGSKRSAEFSRRKWFTARSENETEPFERVHFLYTAATFVQDSPGSRLYRTKDLERIPRNQFRCCAMDDDAKRSEFRPSMVERLQSDLRWRRPYLLRVRHRSVGTTLL